MKSAVRNASLVVLALSFPVLAQAPARPQQVTTVPGMPPVVDAGEEGGHLRARDFTYSDFGHVRGGDRVQRRW